MNENAPVAQAPKSSDFVKLEAFPRSDSYVAAIVAYNYIPSYPFEKGEKPNIRIENSPAVELYFGAVVDGRNYFVKTWPKAYSIHEKANYAKWYKAATGKVAGPGSNPKDMLGAGVLIEVDVSDRVSKKGTRYKATSVKSVGAVPSLLKQMVPDFKALRPELEKAIAASAEGNDSAPDTSDCPF